MPRPAEDLTYTIPQAAQVLQVSDDTVRLLVRRGDLPAMHIGRRVLVSKAALARWVENHAESTFAGHGDHATEVQAS